MSVVKLGDALQDTIQRLNEIDLSGAEEKLRKEKEFEKIKRERERMAALQKSCPNLAQATIANYQTDYQEQLDVCKRLCNICENINDFVDGRNQLFMWGTVGTGKDHLTFAVLKVVVRAGYSALWAEGLKIYQGISSAVSDGYSQKAVYQKYIAPDVLCISDPYFKNNWSEAKGDQLRKLVRARYDKGKATWVTINADSLDSVPRMIGPDVCDRLMERAAVVHCKWPSYRSKLESTY